MKPLQVHLCIVCCISLCAAVEVTNNDSEPYIRTTSTSLNSASISSPPFRSSVTPNVKMLTSHEVVPKIIVLENTDSTIDNVSVNYTLPHDNTLTANCQPLCQHNGVCRVVVSTESEDAKPESVCFCKEDFSGPDCAKEYQSPLTSCSDATCKNGGMCAGTTGDFTCLCKPKTVGKTCERRLRVFKVNAVVNIWGSEMPWNLSFADPGSMPYKEVENAVCEQLIEASEFGNNLNLVATFVNCSVVDYEKNRSPLKANLILELDYSDKLAYAVTEDIIRKHIVSGLNVRKDIPVDIGDRTPGYLRLNVTHMDPCITGNNDCSHHAKCILEAPGLYTCSCNSFSFDASTDPFYPGRRCIYDGLIIFTFFVVGTLMSSMICIACGCRRTIWYRYRRKGEHENSALISMPSTYEI